MGCFDASGDAFMWLEVRRWWWTWWWRGVADLWREGPVTAAITAALFWVQLA